MLDKSLTKTHTVWYILVGFQPFLNSTRLLFALLLRCSSSSMFIGSDITLFYALIFPYNFIIITSYI